MTPYRNRNSTTLATPCNFRTRAHGDPHIRTHTNLYTRYSQFRIFFLLFIIDAFEDAGDKRGGGGGSTEEKVHVRVQQRNGRKCITTVAGLADDLDIKRICKAFKKNFSCNGAVQKDLEVGEVIQLSGDQRVSHTTPEVCW